MVECIAVGQKWADDIRVILFVKLQPGINFSSQLIDKIKHTIKQHASPRHVPSKIIQVADIPRTLSGKLVEVAVRAAIHGEEITNFQSIANPEALAYFRNRKELEQ